MMGLLANLEAGDLGVRCHLAACGNLVYEAPESVVVQDVRRAVLWTCQLTPWRTDLGSQTLQLLRFDVQRHTRGLFEAAFEPSEALPKPRTSDSDWSPLIEAQTQVFGGRVLRLVHRVRYEPAHELVEGRIVVPLPAGTLSLSATASADETGAREDAVRKQMLRGRDSVRPTGSSMQAQVDDVKWDEQFPEHPLARVRHGLEWLIDAAGGGLHVGAEAEPYSASVAMPEACSIVNAPPRFLRVPTNALSVPAGMGVLSRVVLGGDELPRTLDVWRIDTPPVTRDFGEALQRIADSAPAQCAVDGVSDIDHKTMSASASPERAEIIRYVRFRTPLGLAHAMQCWFTDIDGAVFRIAATGPRYAPANDLWGDMAQVTKAWKRIPDQPRAAQVQPPDDRKRWWQFW